MVLCTPPLGHRNENQRWSGQTMKPRKHENMKPIVISMSQRWSGRKPETTKPIGFLLSRDWVDKTMKPWNQETNDLEIECAKSWNLSSFRYPRDGVEENTKPRNLSASCCPEIEWTKPWNHETKKPMTLRLSVQNHETMKPIVILMTLRLSVTMKPWNHKPRNHETYCLLVVLEMESTKPWNLSPWKLY